MSLIAVLNLICAESSFSCGFGSFFSQNLVLGADFGRYFEDLSPCICRAVMFDPTPFKGPAGLPSQRIWWPESIGTHPKYSKNLKILVHGDRLGSDYAGPWPDLESAPGGATIWLVLRFSSYFSNSRSMDSHSQIKEFSLPDQWILTTRWKKSTSSRCHRSLGTKPLGHHYPQRFRLESLPDRLLIIWNRGNCYTHYYYPR